MDLDDFYILIRAVNAHERAQAEHWREIAGAVSKLMGAAKASPKHAEKLYEIANTIIADQGIPVPVAASSDDGPSIHEREEYSFVPLELEPLPGLAPAIVKIFRIILEKMERGEPLSSFSLLLQEIYGTRWQNIHLSGQLKGISVTAAPDTPSYQQLQAVIAQSMQAVDEGVARIRKYGAQGYDLLRMRIPKKSLPMYYQAAEFPNLWDDAKRLLTLWFGLPDEEE